LSEVIGSVDFDKLDILDYDSDDGYLTLVLNKSTYSDGVIYRTDYTVRPNKRFKWRKANELKPNGDPLNQEASIVYIVHTGTDPYTYDIAYLKELQDSDGVEVQPDDEIDQIVLWTNYIQRQQGDEVYLFKANNINGFLGALQSSDEATVEALDSATKIVTTKHPVKYQESAPPINDFTGYGWWWEYDEQNQDDSVLHFCYLDYGDTQWCTVIFDKIEP
jgi:hypothetical protein